MRPVLAVRVWKMVYGGNCGNCFFRYEGSGPGSIALCDKILIDQCSRCSVAKGGVRPAADAPSPPDTKTMVVWTASHNPFTLGGNMHRPIGVKLELEIEDLYDLDEGFFGYLVTSPVSGKTCVAESETGAIIGATVAEVRRDVADGDYACMQEQIHQAREQLDKIKVLPAEEFWARFK